MTTLLSAAEKAREALEPPTDQQLIAFGYAPGNYMSKCRYCQQTMRDTDKRASSCKPCAIKRYYAQAASQIPTVEAGVADDVVERARQIIERMRDEELDGAPHGSQDYADAIAYLLRQPTVEIPTVEEVARVNVAREVEAILDNHARKFLDTPYENERWEITRDAVPSIIALFHPEGEKK